MIHCLLPGISFRGPPAPISPSYTLPTILRNWKLLNRSLRNDVYVFQLLAVIAPDALESNFPVTECGIFTKDQLSFVFTNILKFLEISVSQGGSPYTFQDEDLRFRQPQEKMKSIFEIAKLIVFSMAGDECLKSGGIMDSLECLINSIETFFHPSNNGSWTYSICHLLDVLVQHFLYRWNMEHNGENELPEGRKLTDKVKDRFVLILRTVAFMSIHSKSSTASASGLSALNGLAFLSPNLIIPLVLKEVYPSLQGVVETHRTMTSLKAISGLARIIARTPRYAIHLSTLLNLAIPGIDTNDLNKTFQSLSFIQAVALNVPLWDLSTEVGSGLAMQYISNDVAYLEELAIGSSFSDTDTSSDEENEFRKTVTDLPVYEEELLQQIWNSSTYSFGEFVSHFLERVFTLIENLPDPSVTKARATQESNVVTILAPTFSAVMAALPPESYEDVITHILDFITNNVFYSACDAIALICSNVIKDNPELSFPRFFPVLKANIEQEILENGAGSTRSGTEILPRDRTLIWYLGILNMSLAHAGAPILKFKQELLELTMFLRDKCKGSIVYHISNTVHHALMSLSTITVVDSGIVPDRFSKKAGIDITTKNWGEKLDPRKLSLKWRTPSREEVEYSIELFEAHVNKSLNAIFGIISGTSKGASVTDVSDIFSSNLTYLRTANSGIAYLLDPSFKESHPDLFRTTDPSSHGPADTSDVDSHIDDEAVDPSEASDMHSGIDDDDDDDDMVEEVYPEGDVDVVPGDDLEIDNGILELRKLRQYPTGYFFSKDTKDSDPLYLKLHELHVKIGNSLSKIHSHLVTNRESDIATFKALLFAYKVWFADVGVERTAKITENLNNIYSYETNKYRVDGLRKDFPRALLAKRALLYHNARIYHNCGPRKMTPLDKTLLNNILISSVSIYPDVSRNAQSSLESSVKALSKSRVYVVDWIVNDVLTSLQDKELLRAESGLRVLGLRILQSHIKKNFDNAINFVQIMNLALKADKLTLNNLSLSLVNTLSQSVTVPVVINLVTPNSLEGIRPSSDVTAQIEKLKHRQNAKSQSIKGKFSELEQLLLKNLDGEQHWKLVSINLMFLLLFLGNVDPLYECPPTILIKLNEYSLHSHPGVRYVARNSLDSFYLRTFQLAPFNYDIKAAVEPDRLRENEFLVDTSEPGFYEKFQAEMKNWEHPTYYIDRANIHHHIWPKYFVADKVLDEDILKLSERDVKTFSTLGQSYDIAWLKKFIETRSEERQSGTDYVSNQATSYLTHVIRIMDLGFTSIKIDEFLDTVDGQFDITDKNSHRCLSEIMTSLMESLVFSDSKSAKTKLDYVFNKFTTTIIENMTRDVQSYWRDFVISIISTIDFRRVYPIVKFLLDFKLESSSGSLFRESLRIQLLQECIHLDPVNKPDVSYVEYFWSHLDYSKKSVCPDIGRLLTDLEFCSNLDTPCSVTEALKENAAYGDLGCEVSVLTPESESRVRKAFAKLEELRLERNSVVEHSSESSYVLAATTISEFLLEAVSWSFGVGYVKLFPSVIIPALLEFFNISEEVQLGATAVRLIRKFGNLPCPKIYLQSHIEAIVKVASSATNWHQRLAMLSYIQTFFFRQLFVMTSEQRLLFVISASNMLNDSQLEVRETAAETLSGMIRCSPIQEQAQLIKTLSTKFNTLLSTYKFPKPKRNRTGAIIPSGTATPSSEYQQISLKRHAAVLGLGALVAAFPYKSPPPKWVPQILATLAVVASDPGMVGKSVKTLLGDFKNTRNDTWHVDSKAFTTEQLEDLEGVLWKNYFV